jgi:glycosyltransferase involved in cell wall biosynthesis
MNILVAIHDLSECNAHLLPWRTVCEVVSRAREKGHCAVLVSLGAARTSISGMGIPAGTVSVDKDETVLAGQLREVVAEGDYDLVLWPVAWREPFRRIKAVTSLGLPVIGYHAGGVYRVSDLLYLIRRIGLRNALPYLADAVWPKTLQLARWRRRGIGFLIAMTAATAKATTDHGWPEQLIAEVPPGREAVTDSRSERALPAHFEAWRKSRPFFMFAGPPSGIRGVYELLEAFEQLARTHSEVCLVCLFRSDAPLESQQIADTIDRMQCRGRVHTVWESVPRDRLEGFMSESRGLVLPFVAVPSEIPLAIIEAMRYGRPVITTMTGGTGQFVSRFGQVVPMGDSGALADSMGRLLSDADYYQSCCEASQAVYLSHPTWNDMVDRWLDCAVKVLAAAGK